MRQEMTMVRNRHSGGVWLDGPMPSSAMLLLCRLQHRVRSSCSLTCCTLLPVETSSQTLLHPGCTDPLHCDFNGQALHRHALLSPVGIPTYPWLYVQQCTLQPLCARDKGSLNDLMGLVEGGTGGRGRRVGRQKSEEAVMESTIPVRGASSLASNLRDVHCSVTQRHACAVRPYLELEGRARAPPVVHVRGKLQAVQQGVEERLGTNTGTGAGRSQRVGEDRFGPCFRIGRCRARLHSALLPTEPPRDGSGGNHSHDRMPALQNHTTKGATATQGSASCHVNCLYGML